MNRDSVWCWGLSLLVSACATGSRSEPTAAEGPCIRLRDASAQVELVEAGVALNLRASGSDVDVLALQDYVGHLVDAWNAAEQGIVRRCFPVVTSSAGTRPLSSTAARALTSDGVRVVFEPVDPAQLTTLREHVQRNQARTLSCACAP